MFARDALISTIMLDHGKHDSSKAKRDQHAEGESQHLGECHTTSDIKSDDDQPLFTKRKTTTSSSVPPVKRPKTILLSEKLRSGVFQWKKWELLMLNIIIPYAIKLFLSMMPN